ncbi:MAG: DUF882 domain-containing protein, partial [Alphaproteobacteria bacterium]|nr:DUF882 domain-containing protein [Alphaproteobacteria bacterium]
QGMTQQISRRIFMTGGCAAIFSVASGAAQAQKRQRLPSNPNDIPIPTRRPIDTDDAAAIIEEPPEPPVVPKDQERSLSFYNTHTKERLSVVYKRAADYDEDAILKISTLLRDHRRKGAAGIKDMNPALLDLLADIKDEIIRRYPGREVEFEVISAYRSPQTNQRLRNTKGRGGQAEDSAHTRGDAIDIRVQGLKRTELRDIAWCLGRGGVGDYNASDFVHVDVWERKTPDKRFPGGERMRAWGWSPGPGHCG